MDRYLGNVKCNSGVATKISTVLDRMQKINKTSSPL